MEFNKHLLRFKENNLAKILIDLNLQVEYKICTFVFALNCKVELDHITNSSMF